MITIDGKYTEAHVFTDELEDLAHTQIRAVSYTHLTLPTILRV